MKYSAVKTLVQYVLSYILTLHRIRPNSRKQNADGIQYDQIRINVKPLMCNGNVSYQLLM